MRDSLSHAEGMLLIGHEMQERRWRAQKSLLWFTMQTMDTYDPGWHHVQTCRQLMKWVRGEIPFMILEEPPRHGKSQLGSIHVPGFIYGQDPNARIIAGTYSSDLAAKNNRSIQRLMDHPEYQAIFPGVGLNSRNVRTQSAQAVRNSQEFEIVGHKGTYRGVGVGGGITGFGGDYIIIDDPIKNDEEADSEVYRQKVWDWWLSTMFTRLEEQTRVLLIMTRWHEDDLAGRLIAQGKADPTAIQFKEVKYEAIRETMDDPEDPRAYGEALWPEKYNIERLKTIRSTIGPRWWNALYQQRPTALEGGIIKNAWIKYYRTKDLPKKWERQLISVDATFTNSNTADFVVIQVWGKAGRFFYLLDQYRARMDFVDTVVQIKKMIEKWPEAIKRVIEKKANGDAIINSLQNNDITGVVGYVPKESKDARLTSVSSAFEAGDVLFPHPQDAPWVQNNVDEIVKFPNAKYDDTVDATSQALIDLIGVNDNWLVGMTRM